MAKDRSDNFQTAPKPTRWIVHAVARYPPALGGMEQVVQALARQQHELGMAVRVLTSDQDIEGHAPLVRENFDIVRLRSLEIAHTTIMPGLLRQLSRVGRSDLIHLHVSSAYTPEMVWLHARRAGIQYLAHVHLDVLPSGRVGMLLDPYKKHVLRRVLQDASAVVVPTEDYRTLISQKYGISPKRIRVLRNGTDHEVVSEPRCLSHISGKHRLLFVGRLAIQKNIPLLLAAVTAYVRRYGPQIRLMIIGDGEKRGDVCAEIARLGLEDIVTMSGSLYGDDLESAYRQADLLVLTSINESFGLVLIEGMTKGLPIVSVNIPAVRNVVVGGVNGLLVDPEPEALAEGIHAILSDRDLYESISMQNLKTAAAYRWRSVAEDLARIYDSL